MGCAYLPVRVSWGNRRCRSHRPICTSSALDWCRGRISARTRWRHLAWAPPNQYMANSFSMQITTCNKKEGQRKEKYASAYVTVRGCCTAQAMPRAPPRTLEHWVVPDGCHEPFPYCVLQKSVRLILPLLAAWSSVTLRTWHQSATVSAGNPQTDWPPCEKNPCQNH
jgi:hypothetical protein